jgi:hypothetical protein
MKAIPYPYSCMLPAGGPNDLCQGMAFGRAEGGEVTSGLLAPVALCAATPEQAAHIESFALTRWLPQNLRVCE